MTEPQHRHPGDNSSGQSISITVFFRPKELRTSTRLSHCIMINYTFVDLIFTLMYQSFIAEQLILYSAHRAISEVKSFNYSANSPSSISLGPSFDAPSGFAQWPKGDVEQGGTTRKDSTVLPRRQLEQHGSTACPAASEHSQLQVLLTDSPSNRSLIISGLLHCG